MSNGEPRVRTLPPGVDALQDEGFAITRHVFHESGFLGLDRDAFDQKYVETRKYFLLEDGTLLGFALMDDPNYLTVLAIHPDRWGRGHGTQLVQAVLQDHHAITAHVRASNRRARGFYEHLGFEEVEIVEDHYVDDGDAVKIRLNPRDGILGTVLDAIERV
jgi:ribosomal protein S18 acetylase RimI-like enzyme